jgi:hypothetical protein
MADVVTFDPSGPLRIVEISAGGDNSLTWQEIYSEWKVWAKTGDNAKYPPAFVEVGGNPTVGADALGITLFLLKPWKVRPAELSHRLQVDGNCFVGVRDETGGASGVDESAFVPTLGAYTVLCQSKVSNLSDSRLMQVDEIRRASYGGAVNVDIENVTGNAMSGSTYPAGTEEFPVDNLDDALVISAETGLARCNVIGNATFPIDFTCSNCELSGGGTTRSTFAFEDCALNDCSVLHARLEGSAAGISLLDDVLLSDFDFSDAVPVGADDTVLIQNSRLRGETQIPANFAGALVMADCKAGRSSLAAEFCLACTTATIVARGFIGDLTFCDSASAGNRIELDVLSGTVHVLASCTAGTFDLRGLYHLDNQSAIDVSTAGAVVDQINAQTFVGGFVYVDIVNGSPGTAFPLGTISHPVDNVPDATAIGEANRLRKMQIYDRRELLEGITISTALIGWDIQGSGPGVCPLVFNQIDAAYSTFSNALLMGWVAASSISLQRCATWGLRIDCEDAFISDCTVRGLISLGGPGDYPGAFMSNVTFVGDPADPSLPAILSLVSEKSHVVFVSGSGNVKVTGVKAGAFVSLSLSDGRVEIDASCTGGKISIDGDVTVVNHSGGTVVNDRSNKAILEANHGVGRWDATILNSDKIEIARLVAEEPMAGHSTAGSLAALLKSTNSSAAASAAAAAILIEAEGGTWELDSEQCQMIIRRSTGVELWRFNLLDAEDQPTLSGVYKRQRVLSP